MSAKGSWGHAGDEGPKQTEGTQPSADPGRSAQRRFRSSAFPSSLSWDSDSEKETLDGNTWLNIYWKPVAHISRAPITICSKARLNLANICYISLLSAYFKCYSVCM